MTTEGRNVIPAARSDRHVIFILLAAAQLVFVVQFGMVSVALQDLTSDLHAPLRWAGWVLTMFQLGQIIAMPVTGRLAERFGARRVLVIGLVLFGLASAGCAVAPNVYVLILCRLIQGAAGGGLGPAGSQLIGESYGEGRMRAIGFYVSLGPLGAVLGPVAGGLLVEQGGWRWTFALNAPLGFVTALLAMFLLPRGQLRKGSTIDYPGIALIATFVTSIVFALTELGRRDEPPSMAMVGGAIAVFVIALVVFVCHERRAKVPVIDLDLLKRKEFACSNAISFCFGSAWVGMSAMIPLFVQTVYGMSPAESGAITAPRSVVMVASSAFWTWLLPRTGFRKPLVVGLLGYGAILVVVGLGLRDPMFGGWTMPTFWWSMLSVAMGGFFFGVANPSMSNAALNLAPDRIAAVAGLRGMFSTLGSAIGVAVMVLIASRASSTGAGLQQAFIVMAAVVAVAVVFVAGVPASVNAARADAARHAAGPDTPEVDPLPD